MFLVMVILKDSKWCMVRVLGTLAMSSGKYYWEVKYGSGNYGIGLAGWGTPSTKTSDVSDANYGYIGRYTGGYETFSKWWSTL